MAKKVVLVMMLLLILSVAAYSQEQQDLIKEMATIYTGSEGSGSGLIGGFSPWGLFGGLLFGSIGFIAFVYGKKNSEFRPLIIGLALMAYPYFIRGTLVLYLIGVGLTAALYFFRE